LCARALDVLHRQLALRKRLELAGKIHHDHLFFKETGGPLPRREAQRLRIDRARILPPLFLQMR
jgi:hypothetical protein